MPTWKPNQIIKNERFLIKKTIGSGGFGITYLAQETLKEKQVVIKTLNEKYQNAEDFKEAQEKFVNEALKLSQFRHPHIVRVQELIQEGDLWGIVMEYIEGIELSDHLREREKLEESEALSYIDQIAQALDYVHEQKLLHRDVKPNNIMLRKGNQEAVLIDFGLAREFIAGQSLSMTNHLTPGYAPPEQYKRHGNLAPYIDVYALAATLYHLLTGLIPIPSDFRQLPNINLPEPKELNSAISDRVNSAIMQAMMMDTKQRVQNMTEFRQLLGLVTTLSLPYASSSQEQLNTSKLNNDRSGISQEPAKTPFSTSSSIRQDDELLELCFEEAPIIDNFSMDSQHLDIFHIENQPKLLPLSVPQVENKQQVPSPPTPAKLAHQKFSFETAELKCHTILEERPSGLFGWKKERVEKTQIQIVKQINQGECIIEDLENGVKLEMVSIPNGSFLMGFLEREGNNNEKPQHLVNIPSFYMGKYPITQSQYQAIMGENPSYFQGDDLPVESVSWLDAQKFCRKLSQQTGKKYRLPSEAEWEYVCRAETTTPFHFGETITTDVANFNGNYTYGNAPKGELLRKTTSVGYYKVANNFGLYDMHGNVEEWCLDRNVWVDIFFLFKNLLKFLQNSSENIMRNYRRSLDKNKLRFGRYDSESVRDYLRSLDKNKPGFVSDDSGSARGNLRSLGKNRLRLLRGGSWSDDPRSCRSANRAKVSASFWDNNIGFRVVFSQDS
jgi:eukaryotic-like serine/threonine-protein kinase